MVEERVEEAEVNDGVVVSKTRTTTSVEVIFTFNNNLEPLEKELRLKWEQRAKKVKGLVQEAEGGGIGQTVSV